MLLGHATGITEHAILDTNKYNLNARVSNIINFAGRIDWKID